MPMTSALSFLSQAAPHVRGSFGRLLQRRLCATGATRHAEGHVEVCFVDPRTVLDGSARKVAGGVSGLEQAGEVTCVTIPQALIKTLHQAHFELGDTDEPLNSWAFGQRREEVFLYRLVGQHRTQSGFTSIIPLDLLNSVIQGRVSGLPSWGEVHGMMRASGGRGAHLKAPSLKHPFLFAGRMVESDVASVYTLTEQNQVVGLLISSTS